jgi:hypothetical protein
MATFKVQIEDLTGAISDDSALTQWLTDGAKEIINILPPKLKEKCASISILNATNGTTLDMDSGDNGRFGEIIQVTRLSADSGGYYIPCRKLHFMYGDLANDSSSIYYASATDPAYWVTSNSSGASTLFVKPTTTNSQPANVYRVAYPSVAHGDSVVANFPDEAEYLVVLYASIKGLQRLQNDLSSNSDITTALTAITTEINKVDNIIVEASGKIDDYYTSIGDIDDTTELWDNTNKRFKVVKDALDLAQNLIDNDQPNSNYDAYANLGDIDSAMGAIDAHLIDGEAILTNDPTSGAINIALVAMKDALDQAEAAADKFEAADSDSIFGDEATFLTNDSQLAHVSDALIKAQNLIDGTTMGGDTEPESVQYWLNDEDTEMVQATLQTVQAEIQRAQTSIQHWNAIGDMRVKEIQVALSEADGYAKEVQARLSYAKAYSEAAIARRAEGEGRIAQLNATVSVAGQELQRAQVAIAEINTLIASYKMELDGVPMYLQEAASYISQAQGYIGETKVRMERDSQKYQWYQSQQVKLQQDYDKGIQMLIGQHMPAQPAKGEQ